MRELVVRILELREPGTLKRYEKALAKYERDLAKDGRKEVALSNGGFTHTGYVVIGKDGHPKEIKRPRRPTPVAYHRTPYDRSWGFTTYARTGGLLADPHFNRDIREARVREYATEMEEGGWRDLMSD